MIVITYIAVLALIVAGLLHIYWLFGGKWGVAAAVPQKPDGSTLFAPRRVETSAVAIVIFVACFILAVQTGIVKVTLLEAGQFTRWSCVVIGAVFTLRAIGEFRYIGFFKRVKGTRFAGRDTWLYSPLFLLLAVAFAAAAFGVTGG